jgi:ABC-2 type transport system ATP-binding protein
LVASGRTKDELNGVIAVEDLRFDYPGTRALDGISFQLTTGSVTALVGPNGAGKTTLPRCLAALDTPHWGPHLDSMGSTSITSHGLPISGLASCLITLGLYGDLSAWRCLLFAGWALLDAYRAMRVELQFRNKP